MQTTISYEQAIEILQNTQIHPKCVEKVAFNQSLGRILAADIVAKNNVPPAPTSAMDGFAISFKDLEASGVLCVEASNKAGCTEIFVLKPKSAIKTYTGSRMPEDSDTLLLLEDVEEFQENGKHYIRLKNPNKEIKQYQWVRQVGENYKKDEVLLPKGTLISAFEIGVLAENNNVFVEVFARPKVGIMSIGDEIIEVGEESPHENTLRSVNNHLLDSLVRSLGGESVIFPKVGDDKEKLRILYRQALDSCDVLITTGGMSVGDFDFTKEIMQEECAMVFKGVRLKPGKPVGYGIYTNNTKQTHVFGLPGYPNSAFVTFWLFARRIVLRLCGLSAQELILKARLLEDVKRTDSRKEFRICKIAIQEGEIVASFSSKKSLQSSMINNLGAQSAFAILEENGCDLAKGENVEVLLFRGFF
ncbi:molybdopterin molybdotransferase MoeA [Helicobacter sp. 10-6591]|uniref:molybdopterin molybdotransferase MoeA n=1 Tax=Helicobacter sp. 10-6591 TaxID=2004998 RepID=UPI000DCB2EBF|nr:molybdopterin molybdotransferase MoeA [Helicobacter sp. 10-6591]RAX53936.1 hypothetical protein CCY97_06805 [Helicobacter sp. 10-6591]